MINPTKTDKFQKFVGFCIFLPKLVQNTCNFRGIYFYKVLQKMSYCVIITKNIEYYVWKYVLR